MMVKVMESNSPPLREGSQVRRVHENGTEFMIDCEDGTTLSLQLMEEDMTPFLLQHPGGAAYASR